MKEKRIGILILGSFLITFGLVARLFSISVLQHDEYIAAAKEQQTLEREVLPKRGDIYVQDYTTGTPALLAQSVERFAISATPRNVTKKAEYAKVLAEASGVSEASVLERLQAEPGWYMNPLKRGLTKEEVEAVATKLNAIEKAANPNWSNQTINFDSASGSNLLFMGGVYFIREYQRAYPEGSLLGQVLGFVNDHGTGQYGVEGQYDKELKGYKGRIALEQDSVGTLLDQKSAVDGKDGTSYELTVDRNVQYVVERELAEEIKNSEAKSGSVIVMDPKTGEIIAMASQPSYDPNEFGKVKQEDIGVFDNPAISRIWEPGSIFKPLIMAMALDLGLVTPQTKDDFPASVMVEGYKIETALRKAYGVQTMSDVLANSDNVAMVWVANKIGSQRMHDYLQKFGFGDFTGVDLKNEISGNVLALKKWRDINRATISFGQGIAVTPMQVVNAYAAIANEGKMIEPHIVKATIDKTGNRQETPIKEGAQIVSPEVSKDLRNMMVATVINAHRRAGTDGYKIGGKTGTAQIPDPEKGGYLPDAYNHSFVGIGPSDDPKYVMLVKIDNPNLKKVGIYAEGTAVPLFGRISSFLLNYYQIPPTNR
ncbi:MAG: peptidoglycan glycosyltransferase, cell division protein FtsI (penicillin-binding protein 3) [Patescibacteria group bacterium]|nr:peptidoglycan glycosyltransferase, cell division protein FtsI (penicillin-binding protein 3) [Patescibacteria group bacterium]